MTRRQIKGMLECLHMLLLFAIMVPIIYMIGMKREAGVIYHLYWADYILFLPFCAFKLAENYCQKFWQYLLACIVMAVATIAIALEIGNVVLPENIVIGYMLYVIVGMIAAAIKEYAFRMNKVRRQKAREEMDSSWRESESSLSKPKMGLSLWFVIVYVIALNFDCPEVCNIALISMVSYLLIAISYQYIEKMEHYLDMNDGVCKVRSIPYKRLFGIGKVFLISYLIFILLTIIPAWLTREHREYNDIREWILEREVDYAELDAYEKPQMGNQDPMQEVIASYGPVKDTPIILKVLFYALGVLGVILLLGIAIRWICSEIKDFARNANEEDDRVEMLEESDKEENIMTGRFVFRKSGGDKVRSQYRRYIRKHRKDRPKPYETPEEIEMAAGVADTDEGKELHCQYERVRYGKATEKLS